jgi:hypothetical protein
VWREGGRGCRKLKKKKSSEGKSWLRVFLFFLWLRGEAAEIDAAGKRSAAFPAEQSAVVRAFFVPLKGVFETSSREIQKEELEIIKTRIPRGT